MTMPLPDVRQSTKPMTANQPVFSRSETRAHDVRSYDVCVFGLGPVGLVSGACYARQGFNVLGIDINPARLHALAEGRAPFVEPGIEPLITEVRSSDRLHVSQDFKLARYARIIVIAVGTPTGESPDFTQLDKVCTDIGVALMGKTGEPTTIVVRSTVPPGTIRNRLSGIIERGSGLRAGQDFHMVSNPEFLREGTAIKDFFDTGRIIIGADNAEAARQVEELYKDVKAGARMHVSIEAGEFAKYVDNSWHALKVSFANEMGRVCQAFGGKVEETTQIFLSDSHLNISAHYLRPGFAFGGSCLPKDVRGLAWLADDLGVAVPVVNAILPSNEEHIALGIDCIMSHNPHRAGILGVAFKEHVDDLRESPALTIAAILIDNDIAVVAHDPAYKAGDVLTVKGSHRQLDMMELDALAESVDTLVMMHRLPMYQELMQRHPDKNFVDLTGLPALEAGYRAAKKTLTSENVTRWSAGEAQAASLPPKNDTKKMPSIDIFSFVRRTIFG
jgi:GDP-mannose 6-dehydrogenase